MKRIMIAMILGVVSGTASEAADKPVKVFILAGQSNMEGNSHIRTLDALGEHPKLGHLLKKIKRANGSFVVRDDVFISYNRTEGNLRAPLTVGQGAWKDEWLGPELMFGIEMGDEFDEPVLLIKTAWGGKDLYCDFRPPGAGKPAYEIPGEKREVGAYYRKMIEEVRHSLDHMGSEFPQLKGRSAELCGFVWFQGWNDMCADDKIKKQVLDEYASNFAHLVHDLRAEFKVPKLPVVAGEVGVGGEGDAAGADMLALRAAQAGIPSQPELKGTVAYVKTAPYWYKDLDELPGKLAKEEGRVKQKLEAKINGKLKDKSKGGDANEFQRLVEGALPDELATDKAYLKIKEEHDKSISHWYCHYQGSARVYCLAGHGFAEAMKGLLKK